MGHEEGCVPGGKPWSLQVPLPFAQSFDVGTPVAAWVTRLQQAWHSLHLIYAPGEKMIGRMSILEAADKYDAIRKTFGAKFLPLLPGAMQRPA